MSYALFFAAGCAAGLLVGAFIGVLVGRQHVNEPQWLQQLTSPLATGEALQLHVHISKGRCDEQNPEGLAAAQDFYPSSN